MIAVGANLDKAMWLAVELETIARQYYLSLALETPHILSEEQIAETAQGFSSYGLQGPKPKAVKAAKKAAKSRSTRKAAAHRRVEKKRSRTR